MAKVLIKKEQYKNMGKILKKGEVKIENGTKKDEVNLLNIMDEIIRDMLWLKKK